MKPTTLIFCDESDSSAARELAQSLRNGRNLVLVRAARLMNETEVCERVLVMPNVAKDRRAILHRLYKNVEDISLPGLPVPEPSDPSPEPSFDDPPQFKQRPTGRRPAHR